MWYMVIFNHQQMMSLKMNNAAHQIIFDHEQPDSHLFASLLTDVDQVEYGDGKIDSSRYLPIPPDLKSEHDIQAWCYEHWKNDGSYNRAEIVDSQTLDFETDHAPCLPLIVRWAESCNFTGEYRAISSDLKQWVIAHFTDGILDKNNENFESDFNTLCYELRGFNYFEILDRQHPDFTKYLAEVIAYHSSFNFSMNGCIAKFANDKFSFDFSYDHVSDLISVNASGISLSSDPLHGDSHPSGLLERFVDQINAIQKQAAV